MTLQRGPGLCPSPAGHPILSPAEKLALPHIPPRVLGSVTSASCPCPSPEQDRMRRFRLLKWVLLPQAVGTWGAGGALSGAPGVASSNCHPLEQCAGPLGGCSHLAPTLDVLHGLSHVAENLHLWLCFCSGSLDTWPSRKMRLRTPRASPSPHMASPRSE